MTVTYVIERNGISSDSLPLLLNILTLPVSMDKSNNPATATVFADRPYTIKAAVPLPELIVDTSPLTLDGRNLTFESTGFLFEKTGHDLPDTVASRSAHGGVPPYNYSSSDTSIASVDGLGIVRSEGNGEAIITVTDSSCQSKSFTVTSSNVIVVIVSSTSPHLSTFAGWLASVNAQKIDLDPLQKRAYTTVPPRTGRGH